eukprot:m.254793 g.254793  ORF g.254793 m.254793 type:complete len:331 (-) comp18692_c0_seq1:286-1278(-)
MAAEMKARLESHNEFFNNVIRLIPPKFYLAEADEENHAKISARFLRNVKNNAPKQEVKEQSKKAKRARLDPTQHKTILDHQDEQLRAEEEEDENPTKRPAPATAPTTNLGPQELRARLAARLQALRSKRKIPEESEESQDRMPMQNKRSKLKEKRKQHALVKQTHQQFDTVNRAKPQGNKVTLPTAPVAFSKFEFANESQKKNKARPNAKQLLEKVEREKQEIEELRAEDATKAAEIEQKLGWDKALKRAEGQKVFDNPKLVKKTIKREERKKAKSKKAWDARNATVEKEQRERQEKRERNLKARRDARKDRKLKKIQKRRPGFEGAKRK